MIKVSSKCVFICLSKLVHFQNFKVCLKLKGLFTENEQILSEKNTYIFFSFISLKQKTKMFPENVGATCETNYLYSVPAMKNRNWLYFTRSTLPYPQKEYPDTKWNVPTRQCKKTVYQNLNICRIPNCHCFSYLTCQQITS